jgi:hypothetical protein
MERIHSHRTRVVDAMKHRRRRRDDAWNGVSLLTRPRHWRHERNAREAWEMKKNRDAVRIRAFVRPRYTDGYIFSSSSLRPRRRRTRPSIRADACESRFPTRATRRFSSRALPNPLPLIPVAYRTTRRQMFPRRDRIARIDAFNILVVIAHAPRLVVSSSLS